MRVEFFGYTLKSGYNPNFLSRVSRFLAGDYEYLTPSSGNAIEFDVVKAYSHCCQSYTKHHDIHESTHISISCFFARNIGIEPENNVTKKYIRV